uniref:Uncharacterized protein n=1 Tax=Siphoviridae sp. ctr2f5 TaxID=2825684 RepID=A0A8S5QDR8_9CAUD|nr:MAG TPA: hypothetical protein [Siphoviridae sp. ctr2f5]
MLCCSVSICRLLPDQNIIIVYTVYVVVFVFGIIIVVVLCV